MVDDLRKRLADKQLDFKLTDAATQYIIDTGYDPVYGARPLRRLLQSKVETLLARKIIESDDLKPGDTLTVDYKDGKLQIV